MTSIQPQPQTDLDTAPAELPPLPMAALMIGVYNLLRDGADLPQPCHVAVSETGQSIDLQFPGTSPASGPSPSGRTGSAASSPPTPHRTSAALTRVVASSATTA